MLRVGEEKATEFVGVNWGSSNFRAYRIRGDGLLLDQWIQPAGVSGMDKASMAGLIEELDARWAGHGPIYACGMIGSNIGWQEVPYALAPASLAKISETTAHTHIGNVQVRIVPGVTCKRTFDGGPDILRGEEIELFGFSTIQSGFDGLLALPGTHTKWVMFHSGHVHDFFTSMSGEIYDRLTAAGLLASTVEGEASLNDAFEGGVRLGQERTLGLGTLLFGARAKVIRGELKRRDASSYIRGLLIGAEIADALAIYPQLQGTTIPLIGNEALSVLYAAALASVGIKSSLVSSKDACLSGFLALHRACE